MAYNEHLANRIRAILADAGVDVFEKPMFSGLSFLVDGKLCVSVAKNDRVLLRLSPEDFEQAAEMNGVDLMIRNGKALKGYVYVSASVLGTDAELNKWVQKALTYNPLAKASKK
jgi:hypothetical protein